MLGLLEYIDTLNVPYYFALVVAFYAIIFRRQQCMQIAYRNKNYISIFAIFVVLCFFNSAISGLKGLPNMLMQPFMLAVAFGLDRRDAKVFIILTCFECVVGMAEYYLGVTSFVAVDQESFEGEELLYFKRVNGISGNSSTLSEKVLICSILLYNIKDDFKKHTIILISAMLLIGYFITFNRTSIGAFLVFAILAARDYGLKISRPKLMFILLCFICTIVYLYLSYGDILVLQFTRGDTETMLTGRPYIWSCFLKFIIENPLLGNGSVRLLVPYYSGMIHAHNSFIQLLADNGIILSLIYLINIYKRFTKKNWVNCIPFIILSLTQFALFWGFSMGDVFFFALLLNPSFVYGDTPKKYLRISNTVLQR